MMHWSRSSRIAVALIVAAFSPGVGATSELRAQAAGQHPMRSARRLPDNALGFPVSGGRVTAQGQAIASRLTGGTRVTRIGALESPDNEVFGEITDVVTNADGTIFVLDGELKFVRLYSAAGEYMATVGRSGNGPGEFRSPRAIAIDAKGALLVADVGRKIHVFEASGDTVRYSRTVTVDAEPADMCAMRGSIYITGTRYGDSTAVHRLTGC